jgi:hypothetical protein
MPHARSATLALVPFFALVGTTTGQTQAGPQWQRTPMPQVWPEFTHAVALGADAWFLHGRDLSRLAWGGTWTHEVGRLPVPVGPFSACTADRDGQILVVPGGGQPAFRFRPGTAATESIPALALDTLRGVVAAVDEANRPCAIVGGRLPTFVRVHDGRLEPLPSVNTVNPVGGYSAGLFAMPGNLLVAFGDHHVNTFDVAKNAWLVKNDLYCQLGFRPALDRGGMCAQDAGSGNVFMTLGKGSRSVGVLSTERRFYHIRPRLPFLLEDPDRSLCATRLGDQVRLVLLSRQQGAVFSLPHTSIGLIGYREDRAAEAGSRWETWNSRGGGSHGDLSRERDSACNLAFVEPFIYVQRKNIVRRIHVDSWAHSGVGVGYQYGPEFAVAGAAFCYDGADRIYVYNGYTQDFWALHPFTDLDGNRQAKPVDIERAKVDTLAPIPEFMGTAVRDGRGVNTPMAAFGGSLWALFDAVTRILFCYDPEQNRWRAADVLPAGLDYRDRLGADLLPDATGLWILAGGSLVHYTPGRGFGPVRQLGFAYSSDGGMAVHDRQRQRIYATLGAGTRDFAVIDPARGVGRVLKDFLPDAVSVPGRRMWLREHGGKVWLFLFRGHDSAEYWRTCVSGEMELKVE